MILHADKKRGAGGSPGGATLDELFRRAGVRSPSGLALLDPPDREGFTDGAPRQLTYAAVDRAVSALAAKLCHLGLQADTVIGVQLPNTVENVITVLAVLRAGMIAAPLPLLWRQRDLIAALGSVGAKAIITTARVGSIAHADIAMEVATELFPIRFICAFGAELPDGVVALDDIFAAEHPIDVPLSARGGNAADHVATVTFDVTTQGLVAVARNHAQLIAAGASIFLEAGAVRKPEILSTIPPTSFAGLATSLLPWLLEGGTLSLHHSFEPETFAAQTAAQGGGMIVVPGPAVASLAAAGHLDGAATTVVALWRSPEQLTTTAAWRREAALVDVASFGEIGVIARMRGLDGLPADLPLGPAGSGAAGVGAIETARDKRGTLALRGAMVPANVFPQGAEYGPGAFLAADQAGFVDTGFTCKAEPNGHTLTVTGPPGGMAVIGGYRFRASDLDAQVMAADPTATVVALPAGILAQRLAGSASDDSGVCARLHANGANPLIAAAFAGSSRASAA